MTTAETGTTGSSSRPVETFELGTPGPVRRAKARRRGPGILPYGLLVPSILAMLAVLGYPLYRLVLLSFRKYELRQLIRRLPGDPVGLRNYRDILGDEQFRLAVMRSVGFALACVAATMLVGTLFALMLRALGKGMRVLVSVGLVLAWSVPPVTSTILWQWLFDTEFSVINHLITLLPGDIDFYRHPWFTDVWSAWFVIGALIVWMGVPFVALALYAGLTQIPETLFEAASIDGAGAWRTFRNVTFPMLKPMFLILASLSTIWDFRVFTQVWFLTKGGPDRGTNTVGVYSYITAFSTNKYGRASAMAVLLVVMLLIVTALYIRNLMKAVGEDLA
jgi:N,N'-diacetylchitobiose transport system permease protein